MKFGWINGNPWQQLLPDCTIRNLALASNWGYRKICKTLGVPCKEGYGYTGSEGAATVEKIIKTFKNKLFDDWQVDSILDKNLSKLQGGKEDFDDSFVDPEEGLTIAEQAALLPKGRYVFVIRPTAEMRKLGLDLDWHTTCVNTYRNMIFDSFNCFDNTLVYGYMHVNPSKMLSKNDKDSWTKEVSLINGGYLWGNETPPIFTKKEWKEVIQPKLQKKYESGDIDVSLYEMLGKLRKEELRNG